MRTPISLIGITISTLLLPACTLTSKEATQCSSHGECRQYFGNDWTCAPNGFCVEPGVIEFESDCANAKVIDPSPALERTFRLTLPAGPSAASCLNRTGTLSGATGYFLMDEKAGERLHVHVGVPGGSGAGELDVSILTGDGRACATTDQRDCRPPVNPHDLCEIGRDEHYSRVTTADGQLLVGIGNNVPLSSPKTLNITLVRPRCGNEFSEHDETCDRKPEATSEADRNCSIGCNMVLTTNCQTTGEANDDRATGIWLFIETDDNALRGIMGSIYACDTEIFIVPIEAGNHLRVGMELQFDGVQWSRHECVPDTQLNCSNASSMINLSDVTMELLAPDNTVILTSTIDPVSDCPVLDTTTLPADQALAGGDYTVRITRAQPSAGMFDVDLYYSLDFELIRP